MGFSTFDSIIVVVYLIGMALLGVVSGGRQTSTRDYFLGSKNIPWWAVCFAIVATETSTLTFISIPGLAYATNLNFLQVTFGYLLGRIAISAILLPSYAKGELVTAYQVLGKRFGSTMRNVASVTFMGTRVLADGVRLYATAIPLAILLKGWNAFPEMPAGQIYLISISVMAGITLMYTLVGGVRAVIWTDVVQMFIYLAGAVGAAVVIINNMHLDILDALPSDKLSIFSFGTGAGWGDFFKAPYTLVASVIGGAFLSMASHGTDQIIVQRLLTVKTLKGSQRALIVSGVLVIFQFALFLFIGLLLFSYYNGSSLADLHLTKVDEIFPKFIIESMPSGLSGIIIAGLMAAAMSTLSGSINSLASATMHDIYKPYFGASHSEQTTLLLSRLFSAIWCVLLVGVALFFVAGTSQTLVELALSIASITYGGMLGTFLLGVVFKNVRQQDALAGFAAGIIVMVYVFTQTTVAWTWYTFIGTCATLMVGNISAALGKSA
ncbi:MAG: sodium/solute symporter [Ignavibacteriae bacterium]|nr:sodium/solute symporter [Ignavibacteriota bacterium]